MTKYRVISCGSQKKISLRGDHNHHHHVIWRVSPSTEAASRTIEVMPPAVWHTPNTKHQPLCTFSSSKNWHFLLWGSSFLILIYCPICQGADMTQVFFGISLSTVEFGPVPLQSLDTSDCNCPGLFFWNSDTDNPDELYTFQAQLCCNDKLNLLNTSRPISKLKELCL